MESRGGIIGEGGTKDQTAPSSPLRSFRRTASLRRRVRATRTRRYSTTINGERHDAEKRFFVFKEIGHGIAWSSGAVTDQTPDSPRLCKGETSSMTTQPPRASRPTDRFPPNAPAGTEPVSFPKTIPDIAKEAPHRDTTPFAPFTACREPDHDHGNFRIAPEHR